LATPPTVDGESGIDALDLRNPPGQSGVVELTLDEHVMMWTRMTRSYPQNPANERREGGERRKSAGG
jgi:hypothetical protein